jgi:hypothetical protein
MCEEAPTERSYIEINGKQAIGNKQWAISKKVSNARNKKLNAQ